MPNRPTNSNSYLQIFLALIFGALVGALTAAFIYALKSLNDIQADLNLNHPFHLLLAPLVLTLIILIKRNTLYFPTKMSEITSEASSHYWSWVMTPVNFLGPLLSHASGMSLGREGAVVLFSSGLVRTFKLSWSVWGPVFAAIGFSSVLGNYWIAPIFILELFPSTSWMQKLLGFVGAVVAVLVGRHLQVPHLFLPFEIQDNVGFFSKLGLFILLGVGAGFIMRYYKLFHENLVRYFHKTGFALQILVAVVLSVFLYLPEFRIYQSLGISQFNNLQAPEVSLAACFIKLAFTLMATAVGFLGGEFIPLIFAGVNLGGSLFHSFGSSVQLGATFGAFVLFAAGTRLKWTSFWLMTFLLGWSWMLWIFFVLTLAVTFSGNRSLYQKYRP